MFHDNDRPLWNCIYFTWQVYTHTHTCSVTYGSIWCSDSLLVEWVYRGSCRVLAALMDWCGWYVVRIWTFECKCILTRIASWSSWILLTFYCWKDGLTNVSLIVNYILIEMECVSFRPNVFSSRWIPAGWTWMSYALGLKCSWHLLVFHDHLPVDEILRVCIELRGIRSQDFIDRNTSGTERTSQMYYILQHTANCCPSKGRCVSEYSNVKRN